MTKAYGEPRTNGSQLRPHAPTASGTRPAPRTSVPLFPSLYGTNFRHLARLRRLSNGETVSAADGSPEKGLGRGSGEIGQWETRQDRAA